MCESFVALVPDLERVLTRAVNSAYASDAVAASDVIFRIGAYISKLADSGWAVSADQSTKPLKRSTSAAEIHEVEVALRAGLQLAIQRGGSLQEVLLTLSETLSRAKAPPPGVQAPEQRWTLIREHVRAVYGTVHSNGGRDKPKALAREASRDLGSSLTPCTAAERWRLTLARTRPAWTAPRIKDAVQPPSLALAKSFDGSFGPTAPAIAQAIKVASHDEAAGEPQPALSRTASSVEPPASARAVMSHSLPADPTILRKTLPNGLGILVQDNAMPSREVSIRLVVSAGSLDEADDQRGIAHLVEHLCFMGSHHFPRAGQIEQVMAQLGCTLGADVNATTTWDQIYFDLNVPLLTAGMQSNRAGWLDRLVLGLYALADMCGRALMRSVDIAHERMIVIEELRRARNESAGAHDEWCGLWHGTRLQARQPVGLVGAVRSCPDDRIRDFYRQHFRPHRCHLLVVGDLPTSTAASTAAALERARAAFAALRRSAATTETERDTAEAELQALRTKAAAALAADAAKATETADKLGQGVDATSSAMMSGTDVIRKLATEIFGALEPDGPCMTMAEAGLQSDSAGATSMETNFVDTPACQPAGGSVEMERTYRPVGLAAADGTQYALMASGGDAIAQTQSAIVIGCRRPICSSTTYEGQRDELMELIAQMVFTSFMENVCARHLHIHGSTHAGDAHTPRKVERVTMAIEMGVSEPLTTALEALQFAISWTGIAGSAGDGSEATADDADGAADADDVGDYVTIDAPVVSEPLIWADAVSLAAVKHVLHMLAYWREAGPSYLEVQNAINLAREHLLPVLCEAIHTCSSPELVKGYTPACVRGEVIAADLGTVNDIDGGRSPSKTLAAYEAMLDTIAPADVIAARARWIGQSECGALRSSHTSDTEQALHISLQLKLPKRMSTEDSHAEAWSTAATDALAEVWSEACAMPIKALEETPAVRAVLKDRLLQDRRLGFAATGEKSAYLDRILGDALEADEQAARGLGSACDPLGQVLPPGEVIASQEVAESAPRVSQTSAVSKPPPSLSRLASWDDGGAKAIATTTKRRMTNGMELTYQHVTNAAFEEATALDNLWLTVKVEAIGRGRMELLAALQSRMQSRAMVCSTSDSAENDPPGDPISPEARVESGSTLGPLEEIVDEASIEQCMFLVDSCTQVASHFLWGQFAPLKAAQKEIETMPTEDASIQATDTIALRAAISSSMAGILQRLTCTLGALERRMQISCVPPGQMPLLLRCIHAIMSGPSGSSGAACSAEDSIDPAQERMLRRSLETCAQALEASLALPTYAKTVFDEVIGQVTHGAVDSTLRERIDNTRWLASHPTAWRVALRLFVWCFGAPASADRWKVTVRGDLASLGAAKLDQQMAKYLGGLGGALPGATSTGNTVVRAMEQEEQQGACNALMQALVSCKRLHDSRGVPYALHESSMSNGDADPGGILSTELARHYCVLGGEADAARVHLTFPLAPLLESGIGAMLHNFLHDVVVSAAAQALRDELRARLKGTYHVSLQVTRLANEAALPGATAISFTCALKSVRRLLRGAVRVLQRLQGEGASDGEIVLATRSVCEKMRREKSTALGAIARAAVQGSYVTIPDDVERRLAAWALGVMCQGQARAQTFQAVFPLDERSAVVLQPGPTHPPDKCKWPAGVRVCSWAHSGVGDYVAEADQGDDDAVEAEEKGIHVTQEETQPHSMEVLGELQRQPGHSRRCACCQRHFSDAQGRCEACVP